MYTLVYNILQYIKYLKYDFKLTQYQGKNPKEKATVAKQWGVTRTLDIPVDETEQRVQSLILLHTT